MSQMGDDGQVRITLKDVYQQTQSLEKTLSDSMANLNLTMQDIRSHIDTQDKRNLAADQLHVEHGARLTAAEAIIQQSQPVSLAARVTSLERFKYTLLGAIIVLQAAVSVAEYLLIHKR